ncbi:MAG: aldehyde ferredoxin oxidoreductase family protein [Deltaproteobacteria bacterium]|nr:aldehyde ferredoxin oxidoreductase family protein [Deltaproteobacteria bacterium]
MYGWCGKILRVDLTSGAITEEALDPKTARDYIGGRGLGIRYMLNELNPLCDPFGAENLFIMAAGPLTGTKAPTGARYMVMTKSPLTGAITCSNASGYFPAELKKTGYDMIIFSGQAPEPVYLWLHSGGAELRPAGHIWGKTSHEVDALVHGETEAKARIACIGPAATKGVLFASIMNDLNRTAGRSGVGAVMGSKKLVAVAVRGTSDVPIKDPDLFRAVVDKYLKQYRDSLGGERHSLNQYGTAATITKTQKFGVLPTRNFQQGTFEHWESLSGETLTEQFLIKTKTCHSCPIGCGRVTKVVKPGFEGEGEGPEYETIFALGSNCGIGDLAAVAKANYVCNEMGLDTISMGATISCAMELFERGWISETDIGRPLRFGDAEALVEMCRLTGLREGFGNYLAEGSLRLATRYGHPELAMVSKGQEFAGYDPRGEQGMGLAYATSPIGASHMRGDPAYIELLGVPKTIDPIASKGKSLIVKDWQEVFAVIDSAGLCVFFSVRNYMTPTEDIRPVGIVELLNAATGADYSLEELVKAGERIINAERLFLVKAGFSRKDDTLPPRMLQEPLPDGHAKGHVVRLEEMLTEYYRLRGWNQNGVPTEEKLRELDLK